MQGAVLSFASIVTLATQIAKVPGFTSQADLIFQAILEELSETYDFDADQAFTTFNFNTALIPPSPPYSSLLQPGSGPYALPVDYLRANRDDVFWTLQGVPYPMISIDLAEMDMTVQTAGIQAYPYWYATDLSVTPPVMLVYPPPSGNFPVYMRYQKMATGATDAHENTGVPWFPQSTYLYTRLAGELMKISDDSRWQAFLGNGPEGAQGILNRYLKNKDDLSTRSVRVTLDRRRFGGSFNNLPNTKRVGW